MDMRNEDPDFLLRRAEQEAIQAIRTDHPVAAAAHFDLSLMYGARAREALTGESDASRAADVAPLRHG
ncbi:hypothetical protein U1839_25300 [Sphingomonas sp. RT2P30]|uniref:hypothetical protein n=1 Tax=Parasphingomonas halimpatiens TaxID=3096162 RepID=UPI002FC73F27